jgi:succinate dehydrogenase / fumarate reductase cytochrome b subunit
MQLREALASSVGGKFIVACTGLALVIFLVAHLAGNLLFIAGPDAFNRYSHALATPSGAGRPPRTRAVESRSRPRP